MALLLALIAFGMLMFLGITADVLHGSLNWGRLASFVDIVSVGFVLVPVVAFAVAALGWPGLRGSLRAAFDPAGAGRNAPAAAAALRYFGELSAMLGVVGTLVGLVLTLQDLADPRAPGPALAVAILPFVYGIVLWLLCQAGAHRIERAGGPLR